MLSFLAFSISRAWQGFWRNAMMSLATTATVVLMLVLLSGLYIVITGLNSGLSFIESKVGVTAQSHKVIHNLLAEVEDVAVAERHRVRALLQSLAPHREAVAVPIQDLDPIFPTAGEHKQVSGEGIQLQVLAHQGVQPVKTLAHVACCQAKIHPHAGRQMDHRRKISRTVCNVAASTPAPMRSRSPVAMTSSRAASVAGSCRATLLSTKAKRTGSFFWSRLRQA